MIIIALDIEMKETAPYSDVIGIAKGTAGKFPIFDMAVIFFVQHQKMRSTQSWWSRIKILHAYRNTTSVPLTRVNQHLAINEYMCLKSYNPDTRSKNSQV